MDEFTGQTKLRVGPGPIEKEVSRIGINDIVKSCVALTGCRVPSLFLFHGLQRANERTTAIVSTLALVALKGTTFIFKLCCTCVNSCLVYSAGCAVCETRAFPINE